ncbi:MAG: hypothetical protein Q9N67_05615 [Ghiorsea sp.]|nr:hypothetical protein [Ghiorsea sp.]
MHEETFFRPSEVKRTSGILTSNTYNCCHTLLFRSPLDCVFIPIRDMQYMAILDHEEIIFVDSLAYQYANGNGGKIIMSSWQFPKSRDRFALSDALECTYIYYHPKAISMQLRLQSSFNKALIAFDKHYRNQHLPPHGATILPLLTNS